MEALETRVIVTGILFLLSAASGTAVRLFGRPLNNAVFTVHKLLALGFAVFSALLVHMLLKNYASNAFVIILTVLSGALLLILLVTGGVLSFDKLASDRLKVIHKAMPVLLVVSLIVMIYVQVRTSL